MEPPAAPIDHVAEAAKRLAAASSIPTDVLEAVANQPDTDLGNARRFVLLHGDRYRHCTPTKTWHVWDGKRWAPDEDQAVMRAAKAVTSAMLLAVTSGVAAHRSQELTKHAAHTQSVSRLKAMVELASSEPEIIVSPAALDADPWLLNVQNGVVDLHTQTLLPHDPALLLTQITRANFNPDAQAPVFEAFINRVIPDPDVRSYMRRVMGYGLTGLTVEEQMWMLGPTARNGKSKFLEAFMHCLGDYAIKTPASVFLRKNIDSDGPTPSLARMRGKRVVVSSETDDGKAFAEALVKELTGKDTIATRELYQRETQYVPQFKIFLATNHRPRIKGTDDGIWERLNPVPFGPKIPEGERDKFLMDKLEAEADGLLRWAVEGCREWVAGGLQTPAAVRAERESYRSEQDLIGQFLVERCVRGDYVTFHDKLYLEYQDWASCNGIKPGFQEAPATFTRHLKERGFEHLPQHGIGRKSAFRGIALLATVHTEAV